MVRIPTYFRLFDPCKSVISVSHCFWALFAALPRCENLQ